MSATVLGLGLAFFIIFSIMFVRRASFVYRTSIYPFQIHIHTPAAMDALSDQAHDALHDKLDRYGTRMLGCLIGACVGSVTGLLAFALVLYGSSIGFLGFCSILAFSFILANFTLNTEVENWIRSAENDLFAKIVVKNANAGGFTNLRDYLRAENDKLIQEQAKHFQEMLAHGTAMMVEFEQIMVEVGIDLNKDYDATEADFDEFKRLLALAEAKMNEKHPELRERNWMQADKLTRLKP